MTCRACTHQWCWLCSGTYTSNHYSPGGPCSGLQFNLNPLYMNRCCRCFHRFYFSLGIALMYIGVFLGCLVFGSMMLACVYVWEGINSWRLSKKVRVFLCIISSVASLIFQPLLILAASVILGLAIVLFPITIIIIKRIR